MTARQRIQKTIGHEQPDRVPVDLGGTPVTGMHVRCIEDLRYHYELDKRPVKVIDPYQMLGLIEEDLLDAMGVDVDGLPAPDTLFGFRNENWKPFAAPWGQELLVADKFTVTEDTNGDLLIYPQGDTDAPPSGRMPAGGFYFDTVIRQEPIDEGKLNPEDNLEEFEPLADQDLQYYRDEAERLAARGRGIIAVLPGLAFGDIALVPAPFLKHPKGIRDVAEWYISTVTRQDYVHEIFSRQCDIAIANLERFHRALGDEAIDLLYVCGTDFGTQTSSFCSPETYESLYAPYYKRVNAWVHENTPWKTFKHSCGAVADFVPHFIASGFDVLNPVQCSATGMDPKTLKERFGDRIVFWGGGVDTQKTLPFGTPEDVRREVLQRCEIFAPDGGFVFTTIHNVQAKTPVENIVAMIDAVNEFNGR